MVEDNGSMIGHAGYILQEASNQYEIVGVATKKSRLREGIGSKLISVICKKISLFGYKNVVLHTLDHERNQAAVAFYERLGFTKINLEIDYYTKGFHRLSLLKSLDLEALKHKIRNIREGEIGLVSSILEEAALWLQSTGREMWNEQQYSVAGLLQAYPDADMVLCLIDEEAVGTMVLQEEDKLLWPNHHEPSLYLHKLAVKRQYAGTGLSEAMVGWAKKQGSLQGKRYLRLDCAADRPRLCAFYERQGFVKLREALLLNRYPTAFYELTIE